MYFTAVFLWMLIRRAMKAQHQLQLTTPQFYSLIFSSPITRPHHLWAVLGLIPNAWAIVRADAPGERTRKALTRS